jgi:hypothetical protein
MPDDDERAPGWQSIDEAFEHVYPGVEAVHFTPGPPPGLGGALNGISVFGTNDRWHFVTYGLTELFQKESDDPGISGWGYELTLLTQPSGEPPRWALSLLLAVARVTQEQGERFDAGHRLDTGNDIAGGDGLLTALAFCPDRLVEPTSFPFGRYQFLQMVGITAGELEEMKASSTDTVLARLASDDELLRTDPARG